MKILKILKDLFSNSKNEKIIVVDKINELIKLKNKTIEENKKLRLDMRNKPNGIYTWKKYDDMISDPEYKKWRSDISNNDKSLIQISSELKQLNDRIFTT